MEDYVIKDPVAICMFSVALLRFLPYGINSGTQLDYAQLDQAQLELHSLSAGVTRETMSMNYTDFDLQG